MEILVKGLAVGAAIASAFLLCQGRRTYDFAALTDATTACIAIESDPIFGFLPSDRVAEVRAECTSTAASLVAIAPSAATGLLLLGDIDASRVAAPRDAWLAVARLAKGSAEEADARTLLVSQLYRDVFADLYRHQPELRPVLARVAAEEQS